MFVTLYNSTGERGHQGGAWSILTTHILKEGITYKDKLEKIKIPENINYDELVHISTETREKLAKVRPTTLAQASRIGGVKPADISVLMVLLNK